MKSSRLQHVNSRTPAVERVSARSSSALSEDQKLSLGRCDRKENGREARDPDLIGTSEFDFCL